MESLAHNNDIETATALLGTSSKVLRRLASDIRIFSGNREEAFRTITESAAQTFSIERVGIWFFSLDRQTITCQCQYELSSDSFTAGETLSAVDYPNYFHALTTERTIVAHDACSQEQTSEFRDSYLVPLGISSLLDTPILLDGELIGIICHEHIGPKRMWRAEEQQFAGSMGDFVCLALEAELRCNAERALRASETRIRSLLENIPDFVTHLDSVGTILYVNRVEPRYQNLHVIGTSAFGYVVPHHRGRLRRALRQATHRRRATEYEVISMEGSNFHCRLLPLPDEADVRSCLLIATDITAKVRAEEAKRQIEQKMQQTQRLESLGMLAGGIAHDFNNILMGIVGNAGLILEEQELPPPVRERVSLIERASRRAADLTNQLLAYSGKGNFVVGPINLSQVVLDMQDLLKTVVSKRTSLKFDVETNLPMMDGDITQIRQVIMNLVTNAAEACGPDGGDVSVNTGHGTFNLDDFTDCAYGSDATPGEYVYVEVTDCGCGMSQDVLSRVFDPFFTTKFSGRGLGLAAVMGIIRAHNGAVRVESKVGSGTTFTVLLPVSVSGHAAVHTPTVASTITEDWQGSGLVLLVDDDELVLEVAGEMLQRNGFSVATATSARIALEHFTSRAQEFVLALLDMSMPDTTGNELFRRLRMARADLPIILSSGYSELEADEIISGDRCSTFLQKPYTPSMLLQALQSLLPKG